MHVFAPYPRQKEGTHEHNTSTEGRERREFGPFWCKIVQKPKVSQNWPEIHPKLAKYEYVLIRIFFENLRILISNLYVHPTHLD